MDTSYLYSYNAERYQKTGRAKVAMQGEIEYNRGGTGVSFAKSICKKPSVWLWRSARCGKNYVKASEMNAYAKYAVRSQRKMKKKFIWEKDTPLMIIKLNIWTKK